MARAQAIGASVEYRSLRQDREAHSFRRFKFPGVYRQELIFMGYDNKDSTVGKKEKKKKHSRGKRKQKESRNR